MEAVVFVGVVAWTRYISLGSIIGAATFPLAVWLLAKPPVPIFLAAIIASAFVIYKHSSNVERLRQGRENVFHFGARRS
jgi:glycerol-3-phosphate acyltransferase PlsY